MLAPTVLAAAIAAAYLAGPRRARISRRQTFRADLFAQHGFVLWTNAWYSGTLPPCYSVLYPPLGALLGPRLVGALAVIAAAALFAISCAGASRRSGSGRDAVVRRRGLALAAHRADDVRARRCRWPRGPARRRRRPVGPAAALAAALASLASPVAGLFVALAGVAIALAGERLRGAALAIGGALPIAVLTSPSRSAARSRSSPRRSSRSRSSPSASIWLVPREYRRAADRRRPLRGPRRRPVRRSRTRSAATSPVSGRCSPGPSSRSSSGRAAGCVVIAVSVPLLYWQWVAPVRDVHKAAGDPSTEQAFYAPLLAELDRLRPDGARSAIEVPPTQEPLGGRLRRAATTRSRAAGCASSSPRTSTCSPATT